MRSEKGLLDRKAGLERWVWPGAWTRGERLRRFLLKPSFRIESGVGEDGREALTSEPQREVTGDFLYLGPPFAFRLGFALNLVITSLGLSLLRRMLFLSRTCPPTALPSSCLSPLNPL